MRTRGSDHAEAVSRRLALLSAELSGVRAPEVTEDEPDAAPVPPPPAEQVVFRVPGRHAARRSSYAGWTGLRGRVALEPGPLAVVAVLVALGLAATAWWVLQDRPTPVPARTVAPGSPLVTPEAPSAAGAVAPTGDVVVDVAGKVRRPGIVVLAAGARVVDALEAAGGMRRGAEVTDLNLARVLVDGEQILVGVSPAPGLAASSIPAAPSAPGPLVNLNTAGPTELDALPGVGPVTAQAILDWRTEHGGFASVDQLLDVSGIGEATLAELAPLVTIG